MTKSKISPGKGDLISVEYCPNKIQPGKRLYVSPLFGRIGETSRKLLLRALQNVRDISKNGLPLESIKVPVRFPLVAPNSNLSFWMNDRDSDDLLLLEEEGTMLSPFNLKPLTRRKPLSYYERQPLRNLKQLDSIFESDKYCFTNSRDIFLGLLSKLRDSGYPHLFAWKREWAPQAKLADVFYEARFYGIDNVITTYDPSRFKGFAVEVVVRCWLPEAERDEEEVLIRKRSDVYLLSNTNEFIQEIDGVQFGLVTEQTPTIQNYYKSLMTPKLAQKARRKPEDFRKPPEMDPKRVEILSK